MSHKERGVSELKYTKTEQHNVYHDWKFTKDEIVEILRQHIINNSQFDNLPDGIEHLWGLEARDLPSETPPCLTYRIEEKTK